MNHLDKKKTESRIPLGSCWGCLLYFCYFPMWYPGSGVVLDCIISLSLTSFLLIQCTKNKSLGSKELLAYIDVPSFLISP